VQLGSPVLPVGPQPRPLGSSASTATSQHHVEGGEHVPLTESPDAAADIHRTKTSEYASRAELDNRIANQLLEKDLPLDRVDAAALSQVIEANTEGTHVASPREAGSAPETVDERAKVATDAASDQSVATSRNLPLQVPSAPGDGSSMASQLAPSRAESPDKTALGHFPSVQTSVEPTTPLANTGAATHAAVDAPTAGDRPAAATQASPTLALDATQSASTFPSETGVASLPQADKDQAQPAATAGLGAFQTKRLAELKGSMSTLQISVAPEAEVEVPATVGTVFLDVVYTRAIGGEASTGLADLPNTVQETVRARLDEKLRGTLDLADVAPSSTSIVLCFLAANGSVRLRKTIAPASENAISLSTRSGIPLSVSLSAAEVAAILRQDLHPKQSTPLIDRRAYFVPVGDQRVPFADSTLQIAPVWVGNGGWQQLGFDQLFHADLAITTAVPWNEALCVGLGAIPWTSSHIAVDGRFSFSFPERSGDAWIWWLSGPLAAVGVVLDDLCVVRVTSLGVPLPPFSVAASPGAGPTRVPANVTEAEVIANPHIYTEDPGEFCKPFKNPERVLGERSFFVILRAEQPVISAQASVQQDPLPTFTTHNPPTLRAYRADATLSSFNENAVRPAGSIPGVMIDPVPGALIDAEAEAAFVRHALPISYLDALRRSDRGRTELDAAHPIQWEGDVSRYQATTVARGHIVEFRMRWRSNGYSLGTVAKTLTLAARQTKRTQTLTFERHEITRRQETTRLSDQVSDTLLRERTYDDSVQANLSEWARGESESSMSAAAGGFGFAMSGFVIGGGGGGSNASSSSSQEGGRRTSASEEQRLRDSIRRYGDSLRKLDSLVVNEVAQEETVTGTTEVLRNANYGHSLTVIYYQILRHLKIETGVAGVRECLFVPFAITPFTVQRAYRWRESIQRGLRDPQYAGAIKYLKDVCTNFAYSDVPPGKRSEQPVQYIFGSLFIKLAIERPRDKDDGSFDAATWTVVRPFLGSPALGIFNRLKALEEHQRDAVFQQQYAKGIAAGWVNTLLMDAGGTCLNADFTLATRYQFNGVVRVDFSIRAPAGVTRETLAFIHVRAGKDLPPGSVANLQSLTFTYETDQFQRVVSTSQGAGDLIEVETGVRDTGATIGTIPDTWERRDVRAEMIYAVQGLIEHLNEHVEYYTKFILWRMDHDRLWMLIDGFYVPGTNQISIASVVERDPIAIIGNALVFRVSAGSFLGIGNIETPAELFNHYVSLESPSEPMLISLPTDGLYAQTIMDECGALEEHFGNTDWVLNDPDPALGEIAPELLASRRAEPQPTQPTQLPQTIINLQNAPEAPAPSGLAGALAAVTTPNAFRDMAGLAGTQANAAAAFQTAANLATNFGNQAAALKLAEMAKDAHATQTADQKVASVQRAYDKGMTTLQDAQQHTSKILEGLHTPTFSAPGPQRDAAVTQAVLAASASGKPFTVQQATADGTTTVSQAGASDPQAGATQEQEQNPGIFQLIPDPFAWSEPHGENLANDATFDRSDSTRPVLAFEEGEHLELGKSMTTTVDTWAMAGLIEGGAMIDVKIGGGKIAPSVDQWDIYLPLEGPTDTPDSPYDSIPPLSHAHWHYIVPDPLYQDPANNVRWTKESLRLAIQRGEAAVLSFGQLVFIAGDWVGSFQDLHTPFLYKRPTNIMDSIDKGVPLAFVILDVIQNGGAQYFDLKELESAAAGNLSSSSVNPNIHILLEAFEEARSAPFGPLHLIAQLMASRQMPLDWNLLEKHATWIKTDRLAIQALRAIKIEERMLQALLTNGAFFELGVKNEKHFFPQNWSAFEADYSQALADLQKHLGKAYPGPAVPPAPIPASVLARVGFSLHFLTDAFSSAHMRVPRAALATSGAIAAKVMHDIDGKLGLVVSDGFGDTWKSYGDSYLHGPTDNDIKNLHAEFVSKKPAADPAVDANYSHVVASVAEAVALVHYEAQGLRVDGKADSFPILDKARSVSPTMPGVPAGFLGDDRAPAGPHFPSATEWLDKTSAQKIAYLKKHQPIPAAAGEDASGNHWPLLTDLSVRKAGAFIPALATYEAPPPKSNPYAPDPQLPTYTQEVKSLGYEHFIKVRFASRIYEFDVSEFFHLARIRRNADLPGVPQETVLLRLLPPTG
jgi:hypothetical protein